MLQNGGKQNGRQINLFLIFYLLKLHYFLEYLIFYYILGIFRYSEFKTTSQRCGKYFLIGKNGGKQNGRLVNILFNKKSLNVYSFCKYLIQYIFKHI